MRKRSLVLLLASVLSLASCNINNVTPPGGTVSSVSISQSTIDVQLGKRSSDVTVTVEGEGDYNKKVKLTSENEAVATTSFTEVESGETFKVYAHSVGTAKINLVSIQDETKAASLSVTVKTKELVIDPEIQSFYLDSQTKSFDLGDEPFDVTFTVTGKGNFDNTATVTVEQALNPEQPCISVDKSTVASGEKIRITPSATYTGEASVIVTSKQDEKKTATVQVAVKNPAPPVTPVTESVKLDYTARTITVGDEFSVTAQKVGGDIAWSLKEAGADTYLEIVSSSNSGATVRALAANPTGVTLVATVGTHVAECKFIIEDVPTDVRDLYVSNNMHLNYDEIYFYAWNDKGQHNADWPGVKLTEHVENTSHELCYKFTVDILKYPTFLFNNGKDSESEDFKKTVDCSFENLGLNDNIWFDGEGNCQFAVLQRDVPSISFVGVLNNNLTISADGIAETVLFKFNKGTPAMTETDAEDCIDVTNFAAGSFKVSGKKAGTATVKIYLTEHPEVEATLTVTVVDVSEMMTLYFSNSLSWNSVYLYMWGKNANNEDINNSWPGQRLTNPTKNKEGQDVYVLHIPAQYSSFLVHNNDGVQSEDLSKTSSSLTGKNNVWLKDDTNDDGAHLFGFATFEPFVYSIDFGTADDDDTVTLDKDGRISVPVVAQGTGVVYNVATGSDFVKIVASSDSAIVLEWVAEGTATIVATVGDKSDTLTVNCTNVQATRVDRYFFFSNNQDWEHVYLYAWGVGGTMAAWPGEEQITVIGQNKYGQDLYQIAVDTTLYDSFIINEGESGRKTSDIKLSEHPDATLNNIWVGDQVGDSNEYTPGFAAFHPIEPHESVVYIDVGDTREIDVTSIFDAGDITVQSVNGGIATTTQIISGHITVTGVNVGQTTITLTYGVAPDQVVEEIEVNVVEENKVTYYFYKGYDNYTDFSLYLYNSVSDTPKTAWPGDEFTGATVKNAAGKDCYAVVVDRNIYDAFILVAKEGLDEKQTDNVFFSEHAGKNMFGFATGEGSWHNISENTWRCHIEDGVYSPYVYSVSFFENNVTVYDGHDLTVGVTANGAGVNYAVTSGADKVSILNAESNDHQVTLHFEAAGNAEVTATLNGVQAILTVTASAGEIPVDNKTFIFSNNQGWEHVYVYAFGAGGVKNAEYPGVELTTSIGKNKLNQDLFEFEVNRNAYTGFIINEGTDARKTSDILFANISNYSLNNIYLGNRVGDESSKEYTPEFVEFHAIEPAEFDVTVEVGKTLELAVSAVYAGEITVTSNDETKATTTQIVEGKITITGVAAGATTITLTQGVAPNQITETINVTVLEQNKATYYFYTGANYTGLHLYLFNSLTHAENAEFPGEALTGSTVLNAAGKACYAVEVNKNLYDSFILVAWEDSAQKQTDDVKFSDYASSNMFSFETAPGAWHETGPNTNVWRCSIKAETYATHTHSYDPSTHLCACGDVESGYVKITFKVNFNTNSDGDIYIHGIGGWDNHIKMNWHDGNDWMITLVLKQDVKVTFKYVWHKNSDPDHPVWEGGVDREYTPTMTGIYDEGWH